MADQRTKLDTRLKEVHQTDLTEGRINQDFVDWLKTKGMTYLLFVLIGLCIYLGWVRWHSSRERHQAQAWRELREAALPASLVEVAEKYEGVGSVSALARMTAADELLRAVQVGKTIGADEATRSDLSPEKRAEYLDRADGLYRQMLESDDGSTGKTLLMVTALTGRAVAAESKGDLESAREFHTKAAARAEASYPDLAAQSRVRAEAVGQTPERPALPSDEQVTALESKAPAPAVSAQVEPWIRALIDGDADDQSAESAAGTSVERAASR